MHERLHAMDANLLTAMLVLLQERSVTRASERMTMSPQAMGGTLARLRRHFGDDLLVRRGRGLELTPLAEAMLPRVQAAAEAAAALLGDRRTFSPVTSTRHFTVGMSEYATTVLAEPLTRALRRRAPACTLHLVPAGPRHGTAESQLMRHDLIVGPAQDGPPGCTQPVFEDTLVCVVSRDNRRLRDGTLTAGDLRDMPHAVTGPAETGGGHEAPLAAALTRHGITGRLVAATVTGPLALPFAVAGTDLCAFLPGRLARRLTGQLDLVIAGTPLEPIVIVEAAHWHPHRGTDPSATWLRGLLHDVALDVADD